MLPFPCPLALGTWVWSGRLVGDGVIKSRNLRPRFDGSIIDSPQRSRPQPVTKLLRSELEGGWDGLISAVMTNNIQESDWPLDALTLQHLYSIAQDIQPRGLHIINVWDALANGNHVVPDQYKSHDTTSRRALPTWVLIRGRGSMPCFMSASGGITGPRRVSGLPMSTGGLPAPAPRPVEPRLLHCLSSGNGPAPALWTTGVFQKTWLFCPFSTLPVANGHFRVSTVLL